MAITRNDLTEFGKRLKGYFLQIANAVLSVNGTEPDENGDITISEVQYAQNLRSESSQRNNGTFIQRTTGGASSVDNGEAWLMDVKGNSIHEGFVAESIDMTVNPIDMDDPITATIDRDTFVEAVSESSTITLMYTTEWSADPATYGVTVTGTPSAGDSIIIVYVKEERGEITVANPQSLIATGWNLYNHDAGYAKVIRYSEEYGFGISGSYTSIKFSATLDGTKTDIAVIDGLFSVPSDGYVWVTGGNTTNTAIWMTWSDWTEGYDGDFATYTESEIDFSAVMTSYFPNGLLRVDDVQDEIDFNVGQAISRVERLTYSDANRAAAESSGRAYDFDEDYIYLVRSAAVVNNISVSGSVAVSDHGMELFTDTEAPVPAEILYGINLKNRLERDVPTISKQTLTEAQKAQLRENIGAAPEGLLFVASVVGFDNKTLSAGGYANDTFSIARTGYTPLGIVGYYLQNGSSSGSGCTNVSLNRLHVSGNNAAYQCKNFGSISVKVKLTVVVLYQKNT